jgi:hypothetical protein
MLHPTAGNCPRSAAPVGSQPKEMGRAVHARLAIASFRLSHRRSGSGLWDHGGAMR